MFGRTLGLDSADGRTHNPNHQVSLTIGKPFKGGISGGVGPVAGDFGAVAISSNSGAGGPGGDISPVDTLASFGKTLMAAVGADAATIDASIKSGRVVQGALA